MGIVGLLVLVAIGAAVVTALRRAARTRREQGPNAREAAPGHLLADIGVRLGAVLLILSVIGLVAISGSTEASDYEVWRTVFIALIVASLLMVGLGAVHHRHDRQAAGTTQAKPGESMTRCPHCAESITATANVCRCCGREVEPSKAEVDDLRGQSA